MNSSLVGRAAPDFIVSAVMADGQIVDSFSLSKTINGKFGLLFFYPLDFTFVCPSELIALDRRMDAFNEKKIEVMAISIDSVHTHNAWRNTDVAKGGIGPVKYNLLSDVKHTVCQNYGIEHPEEGIAFRGAFMIDKNGVVRAQIVNDLPIGRNIDEILRVFDAIQFHDEFGDVCPAGWKKGDDGMKADAKGVARYLEENSTNL